MMDIISDSMWLLMMKIIIIKALICIVHNGIVMIFGFVYIYFQIYFKLAVQD